MYGTYSVNLSSTAVQVIINNNHLSQTPFFQFSVDVIAEVAACCPSLHNLRLAGMKGVDDQLLTALAENCQQLATVSIKGCGLVCTCSC